MHLHVTKDAELPQHKQFVVRRREAIKTGTVDTGDANEDEDLPLVYSAGAIASVLRREFHQFDVQLIRCRTTRRQTRLARRYRAPRLQDMQTSAMACPIAHCVQRGVWQETANVPRNVVPSQGRVWTQSSLVGAPIQGPRSRSCDPARDAGDRQLD